MPAKPVQIIWEGDSGQTFNIAIDAVPNERHGSPTMITDHAVETGANISDHIRPEADTLSIEGVISNTPIFLPPDHTDGARETVVEVEGVGPSIRVPLPLVGSLVGNIPIAPNPKGVVRGYEPSFDRVAACYEELLKIRSEGRLVRVITTLREYEDMGIVNLEVTRNVQAGNSLVFTMDLKQVRFGSTETVPVPVIPRAKTDKGSKVPKPATPDVSDRASAAFNAFG